MDKYELIFSQIDDFNQNLLSNIQGGVIICQFDPEVGGSKAIYISEGWTALTGYSMKELNECYGGNPQALIYEDDRVRCNREYLEQIQKGNRYHLEYRFCHKNGSLIWVLDKGIVTCTSDGNNQNQSIITNITQIKENEEKLRMSEMRFRVAINATNAAVFEFDLENMQYIYLNNAMAIFRQDTQAVLDSYDSARSHKPDFTMEDVFAHWFHPLDVPVLVHTYNEVVAGTIGECDLRVRQPDGSYRWCKLHYAAIENDEGKPVRIVGHMLDIDEQHRRTERLLMEAQSDALTGLYNKTAIRELVESSLKATPLLKHSMLVLDIDNFKGVNDQLGHLFGDAVLIDVSTKLKRLFNSDSVMGRIGGDEFVILLPAGCPSEEVSRSAEMICDAFRQSYSGEKKDYKISCSIGAAMSTGEDGYDKLFNKADLALYQAKAMGKDRFVVYTPQLENTVLYEAFHDVQTDRQDSGRLKIKERIFELLYDSVDFTGSVNMILSLLGQMLDAKHIYIFENTAENSHAKPIYEWCAELDEVREEFLPVGELCYYEQFNENGIFCCRDFSVLPDAVRENYEKCGISSTFQVRIIEGNKVCGFMRYDDVNGSGEPTPEQIDIMVFAAKVTGTFIIKKRADESAKLYNQNKMEALDNAPSAIYVIDEQYRLQYVNNIILDVTPHIKLGKKCHEVFMQNDRPCPNCPAENCQSGPCSTEIYNPYTKMWLLVNASPIRWSGYENMRIINCQIITQYKMADAPVN